MINPTQQDIQKFFQNIPDDVPLIMINNLKFKQTATYPKDSNFKTCSGKEAYNTYLNSITQLKEIQEIKPEIVLNVYPQMKLINSNQDSILWDQVICVKYPNKQSFLKLIMNKDYSKQSSVHRDAALEHTQLIVSLLNKPAQLPKL